MLSKLRILQQYFQLSNVTDNLSVFVLDMVLVVIMSSVLSYIYITTSKSLSNRKRLASIFPLLAITTMMVITVIKSSLALSLGLVGALSIIRFRSAIKEPEELVYIFLAVALGLGMGASQREVTLVFFSIAMVVVGMRFVASKKFRFLDHRNDQGLFVDITTYKKSIVLQDIVHILDEHCHFIDIKRVDDRTKEQQFLFFVKIDEYKKLDAIKSSVKNLDAKSRVTILNNEALFG